MTGPQPIFALLVLLGLTVLALWDRQQARAARLADEAQHAAYEDQIAALESLLRNARAERSAPTDWRAPARVVS